jgi:hypothetical protein
VFENRVLRGIFGPKRVEVTGEWRKLRSGELHSRSNKESEVCGACGKHGRRRKLYRVLVENPEGKSHLKEVGVDGRMGSKWTLGGLAGGGGVDSPGLG